MIIPCENADVTIWSGVENTVDRVLPTGGGSHDHELTRGNYNDSLITFTSSMDQIMAPNSKRPH